MKKMILLAAMAVATLGASAQARFEPGKCTMQIRYGGTGSMLSSMPDLNANGKTIEATATGGYFFGVDVEYYLNERFSLSAGLNSSQAGTGWEDYDYNLNGTYVEVTESALKTSYVSVPLTVNWYVLKGLALKTGVQFSHLTRAKNYSLTEYSEGGVDYTTTAESNCKNDFNKFDVSIPIGLSYEFKFPIVLDLRYNMGLTNVNKHDAIDGKDHRNMQFVFTFGYKFRL